MSLASLSSRVSSMLESIQTSTGVGSGIADPPQQRLTIVDIHRENVRTDDEGR